MTLNALHQFLVLYFWFGLLFVVLFWGLLTRFYERFSQRRMYYMGYLVPALAFGAVSIRRASHPFSDLEATDALLSLAGAAVLIALTTYATYHMLRRS